MIVIFVCAHHLCHISSKCPLLNEASFRQTDGNTTPQYGSTPRGARIKAGELPSGEAMPLYVGDVCPSSFRWDATPQYTGHASSESLRGDATPKYTGHTSLHGDATPQYTWSASTRRSDAVSVCGEEYSCIMKKMGELQAQVELQNKLISDLQYKVSAPLPEFLTMSNLA